MKYIYNFFLVFMFFCFISGLLSRGLDIWEDHLKQIRAMERVRVAYEVCKDTKGYTSNPFADDKAQWFTCLYELKQ